MELTNAEYNECLQEAELGITEILKSLEQATGCITREVEIQSLDVTTMDDRHRRSRRRVVLHMDDISGHAWGY